MAADSAEDCDTPSIASEPPDWNSDDEPPEDHVGDEQKCSRDGKVRKIIQRVGHGLQRPAQYDFVRARYRELPACDHSSDNKEVGNVFEDVTLTEEQPLLSMGANQMPLAVEFALRCMRVGEVAEVQGPATYRAKISPLSGRSLRTKPGRLPMQGKVPRHLRFLPVAPREVANCKSSHEASFTNEANANSICKDNQAEVSSRPTFRAQVQLLAIDSVEVLTEDLSVRKQICQKGTGVRTPREGDVVTFSWAPQGGSKSDAVMHTVVLDKGSLPHPDLLHVLLSMKEGEKCMARLPQPPNCETDSQVEDDSCHTGLDVCFDSTGSQAASSPELCLDVTLHSWQRRRILPVTRVQDSSLADSDSECPSMRKFELRPGGRPLFDIEDGCVVLVGLVVQRASQGTDNSSWGSRYLVSWRVGEGAVPRYMDIAVASMRVAEGAEFEVPLEVLAENHVGPEYEGRTPLRQLEAPEIDAFVYSMLCESNQPHAEKTDSHGSSQHPLFRLPSDWDTQGVVVEWANLCSDAFGEAQKESSAFTLRLCFIAALEAPDACEMDDASQLAYLERERNHGNALAKLERFAEASCAYSKALDAVRRTPIYKSLFPTERGMIQGAYTVDGAGRCDDLHQLHVSEIDARRQSLIALHLNLALCARREGHMQKARKHCSIVLGADPHNSKALFRRGSAAMAEGSYDEALADLRRSAELEPQDKAVRKELSALHQRMREHTEEQKKMLQGAFQTRTEETQEKDKEAGTCVQTLRLPEN